MAKIIEGNNPPGWKAVIRCAQGTGYGISVVGCFAIIEIDANDLFKRTDYEGDVTISCKCPSCGITLYPKWQIASFPDYSLIKTK